MSGPDQDRRFLESPCGRVRATEPVPPDPYWRLEWDERGVRRQTSGGRTEATATAKVLKIAERLDTDGAPKSRARLDEALGKYTEFSEGHHSKNHHSKTIPDLTKAFGSALRRIAANTVSSQSVTSRPAGTVWASVPRPAGSGWRSTTACSRSKPSSGPHPTAGHSPPVRLAKRPTPRAAMVALRWLAAPGRDGPSQSVSDSARGP